MNSELEVWLKWAWDNKASLMQAAGGKKGGTHKRGEDNDAIWEVYDYYTGASGQANARNSTVSAFIVALANLKKKLNARVDHQANEWEEDADLGYLKDLQPERILYDFFHFRKSLGESTHRVYVNLKDEWRADAFSSILPLIWTVGGLQNAKVGTPSRNGRADTVVIYCADATAQGQIVEKITPYNQTNRMHFGAELPKLVEPVAGLVGVGNATEPPSIMIVRKGGKYYGAEVAQSFGFYRASIIFMALERTKFTRPNQNDKDRFEAFKRRAAKYFRKAGIDPDFPARQTDPVDLLPINALQQYADSDTD